MYAPGTPKAFCPCGSEPLVPHVKPKSGGNGNATQIEQAGMYSRGTISDA